MILNVNLTSLDAIFGLGNLSCCIRPNLVSSLWLMWIVRAYLSLRLATWYVWRVSSFKFKTSEEIKRSIESARSDLFDQLNYCKNCFLCVRHNGRHLFGTGYHFQIFRSQVTTRKKVNYTPCLVSFRPWYDDFRRESHSECWKSRRVQTGG